MFHRSVGIQLSDLDDLDGRLFRTLEIIILMLCFMSCTSFYVITYFSENLLSLDAASCKVAVY